MNACQKNGLKVPVIREFEPPERVYKKCIGGVIVVAAIPHDAQVRGEFNGKCRTDKATIIDIISDLAGEKIGISTWDKRTTYFVGDEVVIVDFDYSSKKCSTGFHFFCKKELAEKY